ncbi:MAG TPA: biopolymer transporter ExbD [Kofleriaceae bacterium]|nr:biopolymer transporter ExbD [Kofleriaceae bacterium]
MGISTGGSSKGAKSDINITPLIDVVLVLLIIFLVTMPVKMRHISIEVPRELEADEVPVEQVSNPISILAKVDGTVVVYNGANEEVVNRVDLAGSLRTMLDQKKTQKAVFVDFEPDLEYGEVVSVMDTVMGAGAEKIAIKIQDEAGAVPVGR